MPDIGACSDTLRFAGGVSAPVATPPITHSAPAIAFSARHRAPRCLEQIDPATTALVESVRESNTPELLVESALAATLK